MSDRFQIDLPLSGYTPKHFLLSVDGPVATITLNRPERKNPLTFESYAELRDTFRALHHEEQVKTIVVTGAGGNFCSGGDVFEIIQPLLSRDMKGLLDFTQMTGDLVKAMRACPQPIIAAVDGVCVGAGAIIAMASDVRFGTEASKVAFLFTKVGLAGCDMGACGILPRIIGFGRAAELLYSGRVMRGDEGERWGFFNRLLSSDAVLSEAQAFAAELAKGPTFAHGITKKMMHMEWDMSVDQLVDAEAMAQSICMQTEDYRRAFEAFAEKKTPIFEGN
ncbi:enoyl-CoA hydratase family protein [Amorphus orientalis]|uniref:Enoyl-CoA hydratase/carnithine racemase n=1 Tax=Amorphus orientalis TaxID=649198 RepID=A0AAE3VM08_9HYPH|nr:enoyl-CoA hydratase family protein [Amorphus orientalis]MDQ0314215.1 enoyl-CoA hydratase/carnithine racemase [Amorphus orientalis]